MIGWRLYVLGAALLAFLGLGAWGYIEYQRAEIETGKAAKAERERDDLRITLVQAEKDKAKLIHDAQATDAIIAAQRATERKLENEKAQIWKQFDALIQATPKEDRDCASRPLPSSVLDFLRDDGAGDGHAVPASQDPGKSPSGLPEKPAS